MVQRKTLYWSSCTLRNTTSWVEAPARGFYESLPGAKSTWLLSKITSSLYVFIGCIPFINIFPFSAETHCPDREWRSQLGLHDIQQKNCVWTWKWSCWLHHDRKALGQKYEGKAADIVEAEHLPKKWDSGRFHRVYAERVPGESKQTNPPVLRLN